MSKLINVNGAIEFFSNHPETYKKVLHEAYENEVHCVDGKATENQKKVIEKLRILMKDFIAPNCTDDEVGRAFWDMSYIWADLRAPITGFVA